MRNKTTNEDEATEIDIPNRYVACLSKNGKQVYLIDTAGRSFRSLESLEELEKKLCR
jgi:signal recognition particle GTPase